MADKLNKRHLLLAGGLLLIHALLVVAFSLRLMNYGKIPVLEMFVLGSVYLPLMLPAWLDLPVMLADSAIIPLPNIFGWCITFVSWYLFYWLIVKLVAKYRAMRRRQRT